MSNKEKLTEIEKTTLAGVIELHERMDKIAEFTLYNHVMVMAQITGKILGKDYVKTLCDDFDLDYENDKARNFINGLMVIAVDYKKAKRQSAAFEEARKSTSSEQ